MVILLSFQISIKQQEQVLQSEIEEISSKFHQLLESVGIDSDSGSGTMAPPSTPSFMKTTAASLTHVTNLETPTFMKSTPGKSTYVLSDSSDEESRSFFAVTSDCKMEQIVNESDGLPLDISNLSSKTLVVDNNSNYIDSPHSEMNDNDHTPVIEALQTLDHLSPPSNNSSTGSSSSHRMSSSSDGYPKSDESTDNQIVPECYDLDKEFMSRLQYYSDFTLDRQRKINSIVSHLCNSSDCSPVKDDILTRHVEGKESSPEKPLFKKPLVTPLTSGSSSDIVSTPTSRHAHRDRPTRHRNPRTGRKRSSQPLASSTMLDDSFSSSSSGRSSHRGSSLIPKASSTMIFESGSSSSGSHRNRTSGSNPRACSTMLNESFLSSGSAGSGGSRPKSASLPMANSTMITEQSAILPHGGEPTISIIRQDSRSSLHSDNDCESIFTWSIHDDNSGSDRDISLEESYIRHQTNSHKKASRKPPLPPMKRVRSGSVSSRDSDSGKLCQDHKLHKLLGEPCSKNILDCISVIEPNQTTAQNAVFVDSMCTDIDCIVPRSSTMPRSSTRIKLQDNSTGSSSMEARRASLPDLTSVYTNEDHSVPESSVSEDECTALPERLECQGKSSSSNDNNGACALDPSQGSQGSANMDSILTDSPHSVSSGINAPYNSPGTNISSSSRVSCSTTSDAKSSDSNINTKAPKLTLLPRNIPVGSPKVQNIASIQSRSPVFKIPKQNQPLRQLFRFRRKSKTPEVKSSTPKEVTTVQNGHCHSKKQLFPSSGTTNLQHREVRVMDKKAVMRKFKKFSDSIRKTDKTGKPEFETLANL